MPSYRVLGAYRSTGKQAIAELIAESMSDARDEAASRDILVEHVTRLPEPPEPEPTTREPIKFLNGAGASLVAGVAMLAAFVVGSAFAIPATLVLFRALQVSDPFAGVNVMLYLIGAGFAAAASVVWSLGATVALLYSIRADIRLWAKHRG